MRRIVLLLASVGLAVLLASGIVVAQEQDTTPPETTIDERPAPYRSHPSAVFGFLSNDPNATFECKLDAGTFEACTSPKGYYSLSEGQHTFAVRAKNGAGNVDPTPATYDFEVDLTKPKITWLQMPGNRVDRRLSITKDTTPSWAYTFSDKNLSEKSPRCDLFSHTLRRDVVAYQPCHSPTTFPLDLDDGLYDFEVQQEDKAFNIGYGYIGVEVDTVAPNVVSGKPSGKRVGRYSNVVVTFDDRIYNSAKFVNIYKKGASKPLAASRSNYKKKTTLNPKNALKPGTWYTVKVTTGVNDGANNLAKPKIWNFKTKG